MNAIAPIPVADFERNQKNVPCFARTSTTTIMATVSPRSDGL